MCAGVCMDTCMSCGCMSTCVDVDMGTRICGCVGGTCVDVDTCMYVGVCEYMCGCGYIHAGV